MSKIYLAGPIRGLNYDGATGWREKAGGRFALSGIDAFSPLRAKVYLKDKGQLDASDSNYTEYPLSTPQAVLARDFYDATTCDAMLVNLLGAKIISIGTIFEIAWAYEKRIPTVLVMEKTGNINEHMFLRNCCAFHTNDLDEGIQMCCNILLP